MKKKLRVLFFIKHSLMVPAWESLTVAFGAHDSVGDAECAIHACPDVAYDAMRKTIVIKQFVVKTHDGVNFITPLTLRLTVNWCRVCRNWCVRNWCVRNWCWNVLRWFSHLLQSTNL